MWDFSNGLQSLKIDTGSQNRLNAVKKILKFDINSKKPVLGPRSHPWGYFLGQSSMSWRVLTNDTLRSKIGILVQNLLGMLLMGFLMVKV